MSALAPCAIEDAFRRACHAELNALKPGNVHIYSAGHGMSVATFEAAAAAAAPFVADTSLSVGQRIFEATNASIKATSVNTNLGIVLLCVPLAKAAEACRQAVDLRPRLIDVLSRLDESDADRVFAAIRLANPAGLGEVEKGDVRRSNPGFTLLEAMDMARDRDRIARAYVTDFEDIFEFALPRLTEARQAGATIALAITSLHMALLAEFPDSHISRKFGVAAASEVRAAAGKLNAFLTPAVHEKNLSALLEFDQKLKKKELNPGTTADFVVATLFADELSACLAR